MSRTARALVWVVFAVAIGDLDEAQVLRRLAAVRPQPRVGVPAIDDTGQYVTAVSSEETPGNPERRPRLTVWDRVADMSTAPFDFDADLDVAPSISDDGQWVVFASAENPTGHNPQRLRRYFLAAADGSTLVQLADRAAAEGRAATISGDGGTVVVATANQLLVYSTAAPTVPLSSTPLGADQVAISDDGQRIALISDDDPLGQGGSTPELFTILADGSGLTQLTTAEEVVSVALSGNGDFVLYGRADATLAYRSWTAGPALELGSGEPSGIADSGAVVAYQTGSDVIRRRIVNGVPANPKIVVSVLISPGFDRAVLSGGGVWFALRQRDATFPGADDPDASGELFVLINENQGVDQLSHLLWPDDDVIRIFRPSISSDGTTVAAVEETRGGSRLVSSFFPEGVAVQALAEGDRPEVNQDGSRVFFDSVATPLQQDGCNRTAIYSIAPDGSGLLRQSLSDPGCSTSYWEPQLAEDAGRMLYRVTGDLRETSDLDGSNAEVVPPTGLFISFEGVRIDGSGQRIAYSDGSTTGQITPAGDVEVLTQSNFAGGDVSRDGTLIAFQSAPGVDEQIVVLDTVTEVQDPLTSFPPTRVRNVRLSPDGVWVFFYAELGALGAAPPAGSFFRLNRISGAVERMSGPINMAWTELPDLEYDISHHGRRIVFGDVIRDTLGFSDLWLADLDASALLEIFPGPQPAVRFPHDPRASTYDVVRGDLASLTVAPGGDVELGAVHCLADDTPVNEASDPPGDGAPPPGQAFFYLMRIDFRMGTLGAGAETDYGMANPAGNRIPSSGDCPI